MDTLKYHFSQLFISVAIVVASLPIAGASENFPAYHLVNAASKSLDASELSKYPTPGEITILATTAVPEGRPLERTAYEEIVECGFNMISHYASPSKYDTIISCIKGLPLKLAVSNSNLMKEGNADFVKKYKESPQFVCWDFLDEPLYRDLDKTARLYYSLRKASCDKLVYINLIGAPMSQFIGDSPDYASYLDTIERIFSPTVWSYDLYPISQEGKKVKVAYDRFYSDLEIMSKKSAETDMPFWAYCQSMEFKNSVVYRPAATLPYLRFEAFSALAYGAQGIVYWTYAMRKSLGQDQFLSALVGMNGEKTPAWHAARQVNKEIRAYNDVFYKCEVEECRHTRTKAYPNTKRLDKAMPPIEKIEGDGNGVLVSWLKNSRNKKYVVIVNHDPLNRQRININLKRNINVKEIKLDKNFNTYEVNLKPIEQRVLPAGGYVILSWQ